MLATCHLCPSCPLTSLSPPRPLLRRAPPKPTARRRHTHRPKLRQTPSSAAANPPNLAVPHFSFLDHLSGRSARRLTLVDNSFCHFVPFLLSFFTLHHYTSPTQRRERPHRAPTSADAPARSLSTAPIQSVSPILTTQLTPHSGMIRLSCYRLSPQDSMCISREAFLRRISLTLSPLS